MNVIVRAELSFSAILPDDELRADEAADRIGDAIEETLRRHFPDELGVFRESFDVTDWTSEVEP